MTMSTIHLIHLKKTVLPKDGKLFKQMHITNNLGELFFKIQTDAKYKKYKEINKYTPHIEIHKLYCSDLFEINRATWKNIGQF